MGAAERLYTPELLALAVELAAWPPLENAGHRAEARSSTCGSTLAMDLALDDNGRIERLGLRVRACAVGQAAAAIFARHALGTDAHEIAGVHEALAAWLSDEGPPPVWPGIEILAPARSYPGRHGAMLLPWKAALASLSSNQTTG